MPAKLPFATHTSESVSSLLKPVEELKETELRKGNKSDFLFRGQSTKDPLRPRIARLKARGQLVEVERLMMAEFERQLLPFVEFEPKDAWDRLALAQHHGLPTRLLDWSYSATAALWFCVKKPPHLNERGKPRDGVVWILLSQIDDYLQPKKNESPYTPGRTLIFRPRMISRRIMAQAGVFTCHKITSNGVFVPLESNRNYKKRLVRVTIPASRFTPIRDQLVAAGVTGATLFPDLDGLTNHLELRYFHSRESSGR